MNNLTERKTIIKLIKNVIAGLQAEQINLVWEYGFEERTEQINNEINKQTAALNWIERGIK